MMSRATVELDFFALEKQNSSKSQFQKFFHRGGGISKIDPRLIKSVIASRSAPSNGAPIAGAKSLPVPETSKTEQNPFSVLPAYSSVLSRSGSENSPDTAPLTIFYNGTVCVFDVTKDKAEGIFKLAMEGSGSRNAEHQNRKIAAPSSGAEQQGNLLESLNGDLPIARKKSLQRFLEKRKGRLTSVSPYDCNA